MGMRLGPQPMLLGGAGRHLCPAPDVQTLLPATGSIPGLSATVSAEVIDSGTSGIKEVRFYWWKWNGTSYHDPELIGTDTTATGNNYSVLWTFPDCTYMGDPVEQDQRVGLQAIAEANCGTAQSLFGDDRVIDGRGC